MSWVSTLLVVAVLVAVATFITLALIGSAHDKTIVAVVGLSIAGGCLYGAGQIARQRS